MNNRPKQIDVIVDGKFYSAKVTYSNHCLDDALVSYSDGEGKKQGQPVLIDEVCQAKREGKPLYL